MTVGIRTLLVISQRRLHARRDSARRLPTETAPATSRLFSFTLSPFPGLLPAVAGLFGCLFLSLCTFLRLRFVYFQYFPASFAKKGGSTPSSHIKAILRTLGPLCPRRPLYFQHLPHSFVALIPQRSLFSTTLRSCGKNTGVVPHRFTSQPFLRPLGFLCPFR